MIGIRAQTTSDELPCAQEGPQNGNDIAIDYRKLLEEGYVYDNEDLVASRPNSAYFKTGQFSFHIFLYQYLQLSAIILWKYVHMNDV